MDVGDDTGQLEQQQEEQEQPTTVMTAGVGEEPPLPTNNNTTTTKQRKGVDDAMTMEEGSGDFPPSITMHDDPPEGAGEDAGLEDDSNNSSASDVETFNGKIVYNPDGSAYIIEGADSELSDDDFGGPFLPSFGKGHSVRTSSSPKAANLSSSSNNNSSSSAESGQPQLVNALHIARPLFGAMCGQAYSSFLGNNHKVPEIPVMHSYRVFTLKDRTEGASSPKSSSVPSSAADTQSYSMWDCGTVPVKPILMCFICKLSFGFTKSFVGHATGEHSLSLNDAEKELVSRKNASAVIQGVSAEPLLSFLEPLPPTSASAAPPSAQTAGGDCAGSVSSSSSSRVVQQEDSAAVSSAVTTASSASAVTSVPDFGVAPPITSTSLLTNTSSYNSSANDYGDNSLVPELEDLANIEKMAEAAVAAAAAAVVSVPESSKSSPSPPIANGSYDSTHIPNQSNQERTPNSLSPIKSSSISNHHHTQQSSPATSSSASNMLDDNTENISPKSNISRNSNKSPSPIAVPAMPMSLSTCSHHPEGKINGVECPKCDMILGSSRSLGGHMTMMHSRNSCKTLKCPKCNWHYKYQETLEIHMKEKHPENEMTCLYCVTNQPHPRLARGETYTCGYKPYRCEVCNYSTTTKGNLSIHMQSDKHINNVQELQNGSLTSEHIAALQQQSQQQQQHSQAAVVASPVASGIGTPSSNPASEALKKAQLTPKPKANWRCDVCNYETNVARNLRIHMTSEKHTHNMMVIQQNMKHIHHLSAMQQAQMDPVFQFHPGLLMPADAQLQPEAAIADMAYNHALLMMASQQQQHQQQQQQHQQQQRAMAAAAAAANAKSHHLSAAGPLNLSCPPSLDLEHPDPTLRPDVPYEDKDKMYQCCVCSIYSSNSLEALSQHVQLDRSRLREDEVLTVVAGTSICKLCTYKTNLKANFQLHCKTDKHLQRLHHVNHVKEGGSKNEWKLKYVNVSNPVQVRCNACEYYTNSLHKMQLHTTNPRHEANGRLFLFLERSESVINSEFKSYHCTMCNVSVRTKVNLIQHVNSLAHLRTENLRQMQGETEPDMRDIFIVKEAKQATSETLKNDDRDINNCENGPESHLLNDELTKEDNKPTKNSDTSMLKQALLDRSSASENGNSDAASLHTCPFCNFSSGSEVRIQMHVVSQHSQKPSTLACPLCQDGFREWTPLENHLMDTHHVNKEGVKRLLALVDKTEWMAEMESNAKQAEDKIKEEVKREVEQKNGPTNATDLRIYGSSDKNNDSDEPMDVKQEILDLDSRSDSSDCKDDEDFMCAVCGRTFGQVEDLFCHQNEMGHLEYKNTSKGNGYFCWKKGCGLYFATMTSAQFHFKETHSFKMNVPVSERHVYKFRCTQCSLAFKTSDKLKVHMQYHIFRAATKCVLCGKSFRTVLALQKHVESSHIDMTKDQLEQYRASLMNNPLLTTNGGISGSTVDTQAAELLKKETDRDDFEEDAQDEVMSIPDDSDAVDEPMEEGGEPKEQQVLEDYINSQAIAEDSYSDPNRKYKCHRCKVAFTRQGYLTSHNKTLLHRKGEKMSYPMEKYLDPNRPFKCEVCKESFTQKNILLVHYNSVSHLHKVKLSMKENNAPNTTMSSAISNSGIASPGSPTVVTASNTQVTTSSSTTPISQTTHFEDCEKKPYKCNLCKLSYSQASNLDVHVRSVLHQSKASRIQELVLSGELDLSTPLVERPEDSPSVEQSSTKTKESVSMASTTTSSKSSTSTTQSLKMPEIPTSQTASTSASLITPVTSSPQFSFPLHPDHNSIMQQALNLMQPSMMHGQAPPFQCNRCGSMCSSHDALMQHQQLYCFFAQAPLPSLMNAAPTTPQPPMVPALPPVQQRQTAADREELPEKQPRLALGTSESSASPAIQLSHAGSQRSPTPGQQQMYRSKFPFLRPKPLIFRHLLESFGFDVVMQFNENSQRRHKKESADSKKDEQKENCPENKNSEETESDKKKLKMDLPEINRSVCDKCGKGFSSIWVLKAHQEETHKNIVPLQNVEKFAEEFREDYERRNAASVVIDDATAEAPSPSSSVEMSAGPSSTPATPSGATPHSLPNAPTPPVTSLGSQMPDVASSVTANHMAAQMQFNQILMSMGLGMGLPMSMGMNMPFAAAMNMHPPLIPLMMPPPLDPLMASAFGHPMMPGAAVDPNFFAAQQKMLQQQQLSQQQKRARTRINDDQLKILRAYFDINNSPTEDQLLEMSDKSGLPLKVIKHWFRNTLFKERQRNKDSPYNFNNPPSTYLNLEEYEKTGETKTTPLVSEKVNGQKNSESQIAEKRESPVIDHEKIEDFSEMCVKDIKVERYSSNDCQKSEQPPQTKRSENNISYNSCMTSAAQEMMAMSEAINCAVSGTPSTSMLSMDLRTSLSDSFTAGYNNNPFSSVASSMMSFMPPGSVSPPTSESPHSTGTPSGTPTPSCSSSGKRANRTRFTDYQIKVLQEFFETNAYPKDDDLEYLSKLLNLSPRVIVVWFQNARQKARKVYENQPPITPEEENAGRFQRTPGLNYQCKKCLQVFQRYYELIKHQKSSCFKDENPLAGQIKVMSGDERSSQPPTPTLPTTATNLAITAPPPRPAEKAPTTPNTPTTTNTNNNNNNQNGTYRCDKCSLSFSRFELWREHQIVHMMNPALFPSYQPSTFPVLQYDSSPSTPNSLQLSSQMKRKLSDDEESQSEHPRDKRLRTTILPEQLDYLYQQYQIESNPSRKMLENIAREVGLKKRVVQVWFQNTRARERKGQFRAHQQVIHKRCPFCRALFKARSALESHLATRHADQYTKGDINIDALPDGEGDSNPEDPESPSEDKIPTSHTSSPNFSSNPAAETMNSQMKQYYEDSLRKYFDELVSNSKENSKDASLIAELSLGKAADKASSECSPAKEHPLDLSKPLKALIERSNGSLADRFHMEDGASRCGLMDDARSETYSESTDNMDGEESNPTSPSSRYSSSSNKRFRTQMTTTQLKVMKSIFVDYKTPSMCECENLGKEIGLPKRVVQVWFQNARAKEKKARLAFLKTFGHEMEPPKVSEECPLCGVRYNVKFSPATLQEHIFSRKHIENLKTHIESLKKLTDGQDSDTTYDSPTPNHNGSSATTTPKHFAASNNLDKIKNEVVYDVASITTGQQRKEAMTNGEVTTKDKQDDKEDNFLPNSQDNHSLVEYAPPTSSADSSVPTSAAGLFPYMYSPFPGYYSGMPGAFLHHAMYPGAMHGAGMMWNDSNMYSSPLSLLQLPASALPEVTGRLTQPGNSVARFSQDGKTLSDLRSLVPEADFRQAAEVTVDVGFVCKKCHMVYPAEVLCLNHQRSSCFQNKQAGDIKATLKLVQCHVECRACRERFTTIVDFKFHCDMDRHMKRVQKIQREAATAQASVANQFDALQKIQNAGSNQFDALQKMQQNANSVAANQFDALQKMQNANSAVANQFDALQKMQQSANSNQFDALQKMQNANSVAANQFETLQKMQNANSIASQFDALQKIQREAAVATSVANHFDALATRMAMASNPPNNNNTFNNTFDGNASAAGLLGRNGIVPDMAQLFFSGMGMDSIRLGMGLDPEQNEPASKSKTQQVVGCGVDAGVSIS